MSRLGEDDQGTTTNRLAQMSLLLLPEDKGFHEQRGIPGRGRVMYVRSVHVLLMLVFVLYPVLCRKRNALTRGWYSFTLSNLLAGQSSSGWETLQASKWSGPAIDTRLGNHKVMPRDSIRYSASHDLHHSKDQEGQSVSQGVCAGVSREAESTICYWGTGGHL